MELKKAKYVFEVEARLIWGAGGRGWSSITGPSVNKEDPRDGDVIQTFFALALEF